MKILEFCRNKAFWLIDAFSGSCVRDALAILRNCEDGKWSEEQVTAYQNKQLSKLLKHCIDTVPAYKHLKDGDLTVNVLNFPVTTKDSYRNDYDSHISSAYDRESLTPMTTSGSTGTPFTSYQNKEKRKHVYAEVLYYNSKVNYRIGKRIIYLRSIVGETSKTKIQEYLQNIYLLDCLDLSDEGINNKLQAIAKFTANSDAMLMGYSSTIDAFRRYFEKYGYETAAKCNVSGIVAGSEMLYDNTRAAVERAFNCKCVSRYANEENGFLGQDYEVNNAFIPNRANYYIEILKLDSNEPADDGEVGRIVVTDLYNYAMPMVRYETGDIGAWQYVNYNGLKRKAIGSFGGRKMDMIFNTNGDIVSPHSISVQMWSFKNIKQYQFAQISSTEYELRLVKYAQPDIDSEDEMLKRFKSVVGEDAVIRIVVMDEIPSLKSGKKKYVTNEM